MIDGGSTGSRLHIFEFVVVDHDNGETDCLRRGSERSHEPLSAFGRTDPAFSQVAINKTEVANHLMNVFEYAAEIVPEEYHSTTSIKLAATAGMRLLEDEEQHAVYDALYEGLLENENFVFRGMQREDIFTLGGELEGFYGAVAANFLKGMVDTKLGTTKTDDDAHDGPIGALDMGGSSTQIVYLPRQEAADTCENDDDCDDESMGLPAHLLEKDFFSTSYLSYGVDQFRTRLWDVWVEDRLKEDKEYGESCSTKIIDNPCSNGGYEIEWKGYL